MLESGEGYGKKMKEMRRARSQNLVGGWEWADSRHSLKKDLKAVRNELCGSPGEKQSRQREQSAKFSRQGVPGGGAKIDEANTCVHSSIVPRNQTVGTTQVSISG